MSQSRQQRRAAERAAKKQARKAQVAQSSVCDQLAQASACDHKADNGQLTASSGARLEANRANGSEEAALLSEPKTQAKPSFKHSLYSKQLVVKGEDPAELDALKADLIAEHQPGNLTEEILVNEMAEHYWRLKRYRRLEAMLFERDTLVISQLTAVHRFMNAAERGFHKALKTLRELQKRKARGCAPLDSEAVPAAFEERDGHRARFARVPEQSRGFVPAKSLPAVAERKNRERATRQVDDGFVPPKPAQTEPVLENDAAFDAQCEMFEAYLSAT
jgi:hypothetical protein